MMYVPTSFSHRSDHLYKREHMRTPVWNLRFDDRELFRFAVAAPLVNMHRIIDSSSASGSGRQSLEIRYAYIRESFVHAVAKADADSPSGSASHGVFETRAAEECQE